MSFMEPLSNCIAGIWETGENLECNGGPCDFEQIPLTLVFSTPFTILITQIDLHMGHLLWQHYLVNVKFRFVDVVRLKCLQL